MRPLRRPIAIYGIFPWRALSAQIWAHQISTQRAAVYACPLSLKIERYAVRVLASEELSEIVVNHPCPAGSRLVGPLSSRTRCTNRPKYLNFDGFLMIVGSMFDYCLKNVHVFLTFPRNVKTLIFDDPYGVLRGFRSSKLTFHFLYFFGVVFSTFFGRCFP